MPTKRAWIFLLLALALYLLANQTQVGWVYIITDGIIGLLVVTFLFTLGILNSIQASRTFQNLAPTTTQPTSFSVTAGRGKISSSEGEPSLDLDLLPPTFYEDDPVKIVLQFRSAGLRPALLVNGREFCPFAPASEQEQPFFIPTLFKGQTVALSYQTHCDRRGLYRFPPLHLNSKGPFGLFRSKRELPVAGDILVYPQYHPLKRLRLLEQRGFTEKQTRRAGAGSEIIGTREYRPGDSLRQVHWRSTARLGRLVVKEFADQEALSLSVVLDLQTGSSLGRGKFSTFETAIRLAASLSYYADYKSIPFHLIGARQGLRWELPKTGLSWSAGLNYLAKLQNDGQASLVNVLNNLPALPFVVVLVSHPTEPITQTLALLPPRGIQTLAIFITPEGVLPPFATTLKGAALKIRSASPYNWVEMLKEL